jgi:hypothetical protein
VLLEEASVASRVPFDCGWRRAQDRLREPQDERWWSEEVVMVEARKSGPRTERGRAAVRLNPLKHGVLSQTPVIPLVEREEDWVRLRTGIFEYFHVEGMMEEALADQIAMLIWRRYRLVRFETESIRAYLEEVPEDFRRMRAGESSRPVSGQGPDPQVTEQQAVADMDRMLSARLMPGAETAEKIMRYETRLHRFLLQTTHQLLVLQALRKGTGAPVPSSAPRRSRVALTPQPPLPLRRAGALREPPSTAGRQDERQGEDGHGRALREPFDCD